VSALNEPPEGAAARIWRSLRRERRAVFGLVVIGALALLAVFADFVANDKPYYIELEGESYYPVLIDYQVWLGVRQWPSRLAHQRFSRLADSAERVLWPPIPYSATVPDISGDVFEPPSRKHWLGTDGLGRDVAAGLVHGIRVSLTIGLVVVAIQASIGVVLGGLAGYYGGPADLALSRLFEVMLGIPTFFLIITVAAVFKPSVYLIMVILGLTGWVGIARLIRAEFLRVRAMDYVAAAQVLGASDSRIMARHILPNAIAPVLVSCPWRRERSSPSRAVVPGIACLVRRHLGLDSGGGAVQHHRLRLAVSRCRDLPTDRYILLGDGPATPSTRASRNVFETCAHSKVTRRAAGSRFRA
jgi:peptide/nickel transport system permease protein